MTASEAISKQQSICGYGCQLEEARASLRASFALSTHIDLPPETVDLWLVATDPPSADLQAGWLALLNEAERLRFERFVAPKARLRYLIARVLVRMVLSRYAGVAPGIWRFETNAFGRPAIAEPATGRDLRFNLSHTDGLVALAVAEGREIGVDVERIDPKVEIVTLAPSVMTRCELETLRHAAPGRTQRDLFFSLWTLKEAYIKARGMGLALPLNGFSFNLSAGSPIIAFDPSLIVDDPERWLFCRLTPTPFHALAVAAEGPNLNLRPRWITLA